MVMTKENSSDSTTTAAAAAAAAIREASDNNNNNAAIMIQQHNGSNPRSDRGDELHHVDVHAGAGGGDENDDDDVFFPSDVGGIDAGGVGADDDNHSNRSNASNSNWDNLFGGQDPFSAMMMLDTGSNDGSAHGVTPDIHRRSTPVQEPVDGEDHP